MIELKDSGQGPTRFGFGAVARSVGVAAFVGVAAAQGLANAGERGLLPHFSVAWPHPDGERKTASKISTIIRSVGVDGMTTSTITLNKPFRVEARALTPCGEQAALAGQN